MLSPRQQGIISALQIYPLQTWDIASHAYSSNTQLEIWMYSSPSCLEDGMLFVKKKVICSSTQ